MLYLSFPDAITSFFFKNCKLYISPVVFNFLIQLFYDLIDVSLLRRVRSTWRFFEFGFHRVEKCLLQILFLPQKHLFGYERISRLFFNSDPSRNFAKIKRVEFNSYVKWARKNLTTFFWNILSKLFLSILSKLKNNLFVYWSKNRRYFMIYNPCNINKIWFQCFTQSIIRLFVYCIEKYDELSKKGSK